MHIQQCPPEFVQRAWPRVAPLLAAGQEYSGGEYTVEQLKVIVTRGEQVLLQFYMGTLLVGAATIAFENYPNDRIAFLTSVGGRGIFDDAELYEELKTWCLHQGATKLRGAVRPSVARMCRQKLRMKQRYIIMEQEL